MEVARRERRKHGELRMASGNGERGSRGSVLSISESTI
jgi:hypothetical protein